MEKTLLGFQGVFFVLPFICFYLRVSVRIAQGNPALLVRLLHVARMHLVRAGFGRRNRRSRRSFPYPLRRWAPCISPVHSLAQAASSNKVSVSSVSFGFLSFSISTVWELFEKRYHRYKLIFVVASLPIPFPHFRSPSNGNTHPKLS